VLERQRGACLERAALRAAPEKSHLIAKILLDLECLPMHFWKHYVFFKNERREAPPKN
jgi:hypothetical protein